MFQSLFEHSALNKKKTKPVFTKCAVSPTELNIFLEPNREQVYVG